MNTKVKFGISQFVGLQRRQ